MLTGTAIVQGHASGVLGLRRPLGLCMLCKDRDSWSSDRARCAVWNRAAHLAAPVDSYGMTGCQWWGGVVQELVMS